MVILLWNQQIVVTVTYEISSNDLKNNCKGIYAEYEWFMQGNTLHQE